MATRLARDVKEAGLGQGDDMFELDSAIGDDEHRPCVVVPWEVAGYA